MAPSLSSWYANQAPEIDLILAMHALPAACLRARCKAGMRIAISRAMMAITTNNSINVNAFRITKKFFPEQLFIVILLREIRQLHLNCSSQIFTANLKCVGYPIHHRIPSLRHSISYGLVAYGYYPTNRPVRTWHIWHKYRHIWKIRSEITSRRAQNEVAAIYDD
jgi:hypothetical protein